MVMIVIHAILGLFILQTWGIPAPFCDFKAANLPLPPKPTAALPSMAKAQIQLEQLARIALSVACESLAYRPPNRDGCTSRTLRLRRDWRAFSSKEKKDFIKSVLCLQKIPSRTPPRLALGAKTRYDDFVATHINQTGQIHYSGTFLAWHRYFIYNFEEALRTECGYTGDYPFWDWGADVNAMETSPIFDGSDTSMSGNGAYIPNQPGVMLPLKGYAPIYLPRGSGGGCVTTGPFKNYQLNLGPASLLVPGGNVSTTANPLNHNPRCLKRDLTSAILQKWNNYTAIVELILNNNDIWSFQMAMQGMPGSGSIGVHGGGHYAIGGDPGRDGFVSPGDPAFWQHHGMIDRIWWIWQNLDLKSRQNAISGTETFLNQPVSANTTLDTFINIGYANGGPVAMGDLMSTIDSAFCYVYV